MCSRFELDHTLEAIVLRFKITAIAKIESTFQSIKEARPTNKIPVIVNNSQLVFLNWGIKVNWNKNPIINARSETLAQKPTFQPILENRCLVPATAYYEWRKEDKLKIKTRIYSQGHELIAFPGLFDETSFTIITGKPYPSIAHIHDRMPLILDRTDETQWISKDKPFDEVTKFLRPNQNIDLETEEILQSPKFKNDQRDLFN